MKERAILETVLLLLKKCLNTSPNGFFKSLFYFLNYENMITHLQETWEIQNKVAHSSTIYCNCLF